MNSEDETAFQWFYVLCRTVRSGQALKNRTDFPEEFWESRGQSDLCQISKVLYIVIVVVIYYL